MDGPPPVIRALVVCGPHMCGPYCASPSVLNRHHANTERLREGLLALFILVDVLDQFSRRQKNRHGENHGQYGKEKCDYGVHPDTFEMEKNPALAGFFPVFGSACWARTSDPMINSHLLYQLS